MCVTTDLQVVVSAGSTLASTFDGEYVGRPVDFSVIIFAPAAARNLRGGKSGYAGSIPAFIFKTYWPPPRGYTRIHPLNFLDIALAKRHGSFFTGPIKVIRCYQVGGYGGVKTFIDRHSFLLLLTSTLWLA